ncbi:MAG: hypothetical protein DWI48_04365 [Chloroflexi bacterium]|nr:MAG: hypothetical protein DWI48_04365 [Chloroflexota bacterium]
MTTDDERDETEREAHAEADAAAPDSDDGALSEHAEAASDEDGPTSWSGEALDPSVWSSAAESTPDEHEEAADDAALPDDIETDEDDESDEDVASESDVLEELVAVSATSYPLPEPAIEEPQGPGRAEALISGWASRMPALALPIPVESIILTVLVTIAFLAFVLIEPTPRWAALLGAILAALGTDGVLRTARRDVFGMGADTTPFLFLPTLFALGAPVFIEYNVEGFWVIPAALIAGLAFGGVVIAELASVREDEPLRVPARFFAAAATYFVVFALFSLAYAFDLGLGASVVAVALIGMLLAVELLRDDQIDALETIVLSGVIGVIAGEARWVLQYMPVDGYLAGLTLLLLFYFTSGVAHAYVTRQLDRTVAAEYGGVALVGVVLVVGVRVFGVA